jgi:hypothetical protein
MATWGRLVVVGPDGRVVASCALVGRGPPDLGAVDALARALLAARRAGGSVRVDGACEELAALLGLAGLLGEVGGQPERGEQRLGVEEGVERRDPVA